MQVDKLEKNKVKITFSVQPEHFEEGLAQSYLKNRGKFRVAGFRQGRAPRKVIEMQYGKDAFFDDAYNFVLEDAYPQAVKESGLEVVSKPKLDIVSSSVEEGVVFTAEVFTKPEVVLPEYKGLTYTKTDPPPKNGSLNSSKSGIIFAIFSTALLFPPGYLNGLFIISNSQF